jgi:hypothetical protein
MFYSISCFFLEQFWLCLSELNFVQTQSDNNEENQ